jgi:hypothetical protein
MCIFKKINYHLMRLFSVCIFLFCWIIAESQQTFIPHNITFGSKPNQLAIADVDGDSDLDLVVTYRIGNILVWYPNNGNGYFGNQRIINNSIEEFSQSVITVDLDNDGDVDILTGDYGSINWYQNDGLGNFSSNQVICDTISGISQVYARDVDNDSLIDILSASIGEDKIAWYKNLGNGIFGSQQIISINADGASNVWAEDIDNDNLVDVLSSSLYDNKVAWYKNLGSGSFSAEQLISGNAAFATYATTANMDNDSLMDVVYRKGSNMVWQKNLGNGNFSPETYINTSTSGYYYACIDIDNDNDTDIIVPSWGTDTLYWQENLGNGIFGPKQVISTQIDHPKGISVGDFTNNGAYDIAVGGYNDNRIYIFHSKGLNFYELKQILSYSNTEPICVFSDDLNEDGLNDVLVASRDDNTIGWYKNLGNQKFSFQNIINDAVNGALYVYSKDMDNDGFSDVLSSGTQSGLIWQKNLGNDTLGLAQLIHPTFFGKNICAKDFNGDSMQDVIASFPDPSPPGTDILWFENQGNGNFSSGNLVINTNAVKSIDSGYLNDDGHNDIVFCTSSVLSYGINGGTANFTFQVISPSLNLGGSSVCIGDLNNDGFNDIVATINLSGQTYEEVKWFPNDSTGNFSTGYIIDTLSGFGRGLYLRDMNNDGLKDIVAASDNEVSWIENLGNGLFNSLQVIDSETSTISIYPEELDNDQDHDIVVCNFSQNKVYWFENTLNNLIDTITICSGDSAFIFGAYQTIPGDYMDSLLTSSGSDSIVIIRLENYPTYFPLDTIWICEGDSYDFNGQTLTTAGVYYSTFQSIHGCDSILELPLELIPFPVVSIDDFNPDSASLNAGVIALPIGNPSGGEYTGAGVTSQGFDPSLTGTGEFWITYSYTDTITNCTGPDSTSIIVYDPLGINESVIDLVNLFPNPGTDKFTLIGSDIQSVQIHNISGELIRKLDSKNKNRLDFNLVGQAKGVYFIRIVNAEEEITKLLILM